VAAGGSVRRSQSSSSTRTSAAINASDVRLAPPTTANPACGAARRVVVVARSAKAKGEDLRVPIRRGGTRAGVPSYAACVSLSPVPCPDGAQQETSAFDVQADPGGGRRSSDVVVSTASRRVRTLLKVLDGDDEHAKIVYAAGLRPSSRPGAGAAVDVDGVGASAALPWPEPRRGGQARGAHRRRDRRTPDSRGHCASPAQTGPETPLRTWVISRRAHCSAFAHA
jgi:hypothetical protein